LSFSRGERNEFVVEELEDLLLALERIGGEILAPSHRSQQHKSGQGHAGNEVFVHGVYCPRRMPGIRETLPFHSRYPGGRLRVRARYQAYQLVDELGKRVLRDRGMWQRGDLHDIEAYQPP